MLHQQWYGSLCVSFCCLLVIVLRPVNRYGHPKAIGMAGSPRKEYGKEQGRTLLIVRSIKESRTVFEILLGQLYST